MKEQLIKNLVKSYKEKEIAEETFLKAFKNVSNLVPKKVTIKGKNGKTFQAIRWVSPDTNEPVKHAKIKKQKEEITGDSITEKVTNIIESSETTANKVRLLINEGIYDKKVLTLLTGSYETSYYLTKETEINTEELNSSKAEELLKSEIREEQSHNDTSEDLENNPILEKRDIKELWDSYRENLETVIDGEWKFALSFGLGGLGKTYTFDQLAEEKELREYDPEVQPDKDQYDYVKISGRITAAQVYAEMYRHRDKLIVFDDCDSFLQLPDVQGYLKTGLDTAGKNRISNLTGATLYNVDGEKGSGKIPKTFRFTGRLIAISNLKIKDFDPAVFSRALPSNLTMSVDETMEKLDEIRGHIKFYNADHTEVVERSQKARDIAYEVLDKMKYKIGSKINTRLYSTGVVKADIGLKKGKSIEEIKSLVRGLYNSSDLDMETNILKQNKEK